MSTEGYPAGPGGEPAATMSVTLAPPAAASMATRRPASPGPRKGFPWPWLDRTGRLSWLKLSVLVAALLPGAAVAWMLAAGQMGAEPWKAAAREIGVITIRMLVLTLAVTPLRALADWPRIVLVRRMLGVITLGYGLAHLGLYAAHMNGDLAKVASEIALRTYLTIGFVALLGMAVLGVTSTDGWMKRLGRRWKKLHRLVFPIAALGLFHFFLQSRAGVEEPTLMTGLFLWLLLWRALPGELRVRAFGLAALVPLAAIGTAAVEYAWYAFATHVPAYRVFLANFDLAAAPRPAQLVALCAVAAVLLPLRVRAGAALRRVFGARAPG